MAAEVLISHVITFFCQCHGFTLISHKLTSQITAEFNKVQNEYYNSLIVEMKDDCETYRKATE